MTFAAFIVSISYYDEGDLLCMSGVMGFDRTVAFVLGIKAGMKKNDLKMLLPDLLDCKYHPFFIKLKRSCSFSL